MSKYSSRVLLALSFSLTLVPVPATRQIVTSHQHHSLFVYFTTMARFAAFLFAVSSVLCIATATPMPAADLEKRASGRVSPVPRSLARHAYSTPLLLLGYLLRHWSRRVRFCKYKQRQDHCHFCVHLRQWLSLWRGENSFVDRPVTLLTRFGA